MQKTGLTNYCSFLVWSCLVGKRVIYGSDHYGAVNNHFTVYWAIFGMVKNKHPNTQLVDPRASGLLTSENAVFCNKALK